MPPKQKKNAVILVGNVGISSLDRSSSEDEPFIDKMKLAMKILVQKKIFLQPNDVMQIITMGAEMKNNPEQMEHIYFYDENALVPDWDMVKYVDGLSATSKESNWLEGLHVALEYKKRQLEGLYYRTVIVILSNFKESAKIVDEYDPEPINTDIVNNHEDLILLFVGENSLDDQSKLSPSERLVAQVVDGAAAQYERIDDLIKNRRFYRAPEGKSMPWKFTLDCWGFEIPCVSYIATREDDTSDERWEVTGGETKEPVEKAEDEDEASEGVVKKSMALDADRNEVADEDIIHGYEFAGTYVPVTDEDEAAMEYSGTVKGMLLHSFVPQSDIKLEHWCGLGSRVVLPQDEPSCAEESQANARAFYSFVKAMAEEKSAALVRKVYNNNNEPCMAVLFPRMDEDSVWGLVHIELPYGDTLQLIERMPAPPLEKIVTKEQTKALDDYITALMVDDDEPEYLNSGKFPDVPDQYTYDCLAHRALHPDSALPPPSDYLLDYIRPPASIRARIKPAVERLEALFPMPEPPKKPAKKEKSHGDDAMDEVAKVEEDGAKDGAKDGVEVRNGGGEERMETNGNDDAVVGNGLFKADSLDIKADDLDDM